ncbi:MFS transporter, partial [Limosilactobacillus fermentum]|nr:MFS transporter [Limosilactobacillus fermentum]
QIIASVASFAIFPLIGKSMPGMLLLAGIIFASGALFVSRIQEQPNA